MTMKQLEEVPQRLWIFESQGHNDPGEHRWVLLRSLNQKLHEFENRKNNGQIHNTCR